MLVFVKGHQTGHRDTGQFQSDIEHEETAGAHHEIHSQQGTEREQIELAGLVTCILTTDPRTGLKNHQQGAHGENGLHHGSHRSGMIHSAEQHLIGNRQIRCDVHHQQSESHELKDAVVGLPDNQVAQKKDDDNERKHHLRLHM